jgi:hypothetical protein
VLRVLVPPMLGYREHADRELECVRTVHVVHHFYVVLYCLSSASAVIILVLAKGRARMHTTDLGTGYCTTLRPEARMR